MIARVDGTPDWTKLPRLALENRLWGTQADIAAWAQIAWCDSALHLHLQAREKSIRAEEQGPLGSPCEDSCLEFFFCPVAGDDRYINVEVSPTGCVYLGIASCIGDLIRLIPEEPVLTPETRRTDDGWEVRYSIPFAFIRRLFPAFDPKPGSSLRANFFKCGDSTPEPHFLSWSPVYTPTPDFHRPEFFGELVFA